MTRKILPLMLLILAVPALAQDPADKISPLLEQALAGDIDIASEADGSWAVWVHFSDKNLEGAALTAALDQAERDLNERAARRRAKVVPAGQRLVDASDLPLAPVYLDAVSATGAEARRQSRWLNAASFNADRAEIAAIAALPFVREVSLVAKFARTEPEVTPAEKAAAERLQDEAEALAEDRWTLEYGGSTGGLQLINVPPIHEMGVTAEGVILASLDSGFRMTHETLEDVTVIDQWDFVGDDPIVDEEPGDAFNAAKHGTETTSVLMGFENGSLIGPAFGASIILARTEDVGSETPIEEDNWVAGIEWVESLGADVVTSSLGYYYWYEFSDLDGNTALCTIAADAAVDRGLPVFTSAGNERQNSEWPHITAPADGDGVIAMAAVDLSGDLASFSSPGPTYDGRIKPDVAALGVYAFVASYYDPHQYGASNGTSFACPQVAGVAALMLERIPSLTPAQIAEALRMTADRADNPNNDYGWGIIDAFAALNYWGPAIVHEPLVDTEDTVGPYTVLATITDQEPLDPGTLFMYWRVDSGAWSQVALTALGDDQFSADIPGQPSGGAVEYYLEAGDVSGIVVQMPHNGVENAYSFTVGTDVSAPMFFHAPLIDQLPSQWPTMVVAEATDNIGIDRVELNYSRNGEPMQGPYTLNHVGEGIYELMFPLLTIQVGDEIVYEVTAYDTADIPNESFSGPHLFYGVASLGSVLVIKDDPIGAPEAAAGDGGGNQPVDTDASADLIMQWLQEAGYAVDQVEADVLNPGAFEGYDALVYSSGNNTQCLGNPTAREMVIAWVEDGGRIFVEGGVLTEQCRYNYPNLPLYSEFADIVLHAEDWWGSFIEQANFHTATGREHHYFVTRPHLMPSPYSLSDIGYDFGAAGSTYAAEEALPIYRTVYNERSCGILLYDDNTAPEAGQIVFASFDLSYASEADGRALTENALAYILAREAPGEASISGTVDLADSDDNSGVTVSVGPNNSVVTGADGDYVLDGLHGATYTVTATKAGYGPEQRPVILGQFDHATGVNFFLQPIIEVSYTANPEIGIPDNDDEGVTSVITVAEEGDLFDLSIDVNISHPSRGQLIVELTSPTGTVVTLHNLSGGIADDIVGNWPATLSVDGPGALADFVGEDIQGGWTLRVADTVWGASGGVLHSWGLNVQATAGVISAVQGDEGNNLPTLTQITGNVPNPFNPTTVIAFEVATAGPVTLDIFDLRGARVRTLVSGEMPAGRYEMTWDGRDDGSRGMASGVYFCRLQAGSKTDLLKMTLVR